MKKKLFVYSQEGAVQRPKVVFKVGIRASASFISDQSGQTAVLFVELEFERA